MVVVACVVVEGEKVSLKVEKEEGKNDVKKKGSQSPRSTTKGEKKTRGKRTRRTKRPAGPTPPPPSLAFLSFSPSPKVSRHTLVDKISE